MSFHKSSKKDEEKDRELEIKMEQAALAVAEQEQPTATTKVDTKGLEKELVKRETNLSTFAIADENYRKRVLKGDYAELKTKYGWLYDQPIKAE